MKGQARWFSHNLKKKKNECKVQRIRLLNRAFKKMYFFYFFFLIVINLNNKKLASIERSQNIWNVHFFFKMLHKNVYNIPFFVYLPVVCRINFFSCSLYLFIARLSACHVEGQFLRMCVGVYFFYHQTWMQKDKQSFGRGGAAAVGRKHPRTKVAANDLVMQMTCDNVSHSHSEREAFSVDEPVECPCTPPQTIGIGTHFPTAACARDGSVSSALRECVVWPKAIWARSVFAYDAIVVAKIIIHNNGGVGGVLHSSPWPQKGGLGPRG